jgi:hypothetical protein
MTKFTIIQADGLYAVSKQAHLLSYMYLKTNIHPSIQSSKGLIPVHIQTTTRFNPSKKKKEQQTNDFLTLPISTNTGRRRRALPLRQIPPARPRPRSRILATKPLARGPGVPKTLVFDPAGSARAGEWYHVVEVEDDGGGCEAVSEVGSVSGMKQKLEGFSRPNRNRNRNHDQNFGMACYVVSCSLFCIASDAMR